MVNPFNSGERIPFNEADPERVAESIAIDAWWASLSPLYRTHIFMLAAEALINDPKKTPIIGKYGDKFYMVAAEEISKEKAERITKEFKSKSHYSPWHKETRDNPGSSTPENN